MQSTSKLDQNTTNLSPRLTIVTRQRWPLDDCAFLLPAARLQGRLLKS